MIDHALNIDLARRKALRGLLEKAKAERRHDEITSIAADLAACQRRISERLVSA